MRTELRAMVSLAWPVILAEMAWILMGIVDTIVVGPLGPAAIGAVGTGSSIFFALMVLGMGTTYALDTFVAQSFGAGRIGECHRWLFAGLQLAAVMAVILITTGYVGIAALTYSGMRPEILAILQPYLYRLLWSAPPLLVYTVFRRYLQAMNCVGPITVAAIATNVINLAANWMFVYGHLGVPAMGAVGAAYATLVARVAMAVMLCVVIWEREHRRPSGLHDVPFEWEFARVWQLVRLGVPIAAQIMAEVGVFATAAVLAGRISATALAANQIVLNVAGFFFMIPYGLGSAAAVRVGHAAGRHDAHGVRRSGWVALSCALAVAVIVATLYLAIPHVFLEIFTTDATVLAVGTKILIVCAIFQPFDGFQAVGTGALRGIGDTRTPMIVNFVAHWLIGLPVAYWLCFYRGWGVLGLWSGLGGSLILVGASVLVAWHWETR